MSIKLIVAVALGLTVAACEGAGQKQQIGTLLGGVAGAVAGAQFGSGKGQLAATATGALLGALVGSEVGKSLDRADRLAMQQTAQRTLEDDPTGTTGQWKNPDSGNSGTITPTRTFQKTDGQYCREYQQTITVGGQLEEAYGTACRQPDGTWQIVSN